MADSGAGPRSVTVGTARSPAAALHGLRGIDGVQVDGRRQRSGQIWESHLT